MDLYDLFQDFRIARAMLASQDAKISADVSAYNTELLGRKVDTLSLVVVALSEMLEDMGFTQEMIMAKVAEIDLRDGKRDGKIAATNTCGGCGREIASRHVECIYCGVKVERKSVL